MNAVVARFAPSPTGFLHIGGIRTALINFIIVEQTKLIDPESKFFLRIEDTDKKRSKDEYKKNILNGLNWLGINWQGKPMIQSKKIDRHKEIAYELLQQGKAYKCICSFDELETRRIENQKKKLNIKRLCKKCEKDNKIQKLDKNYCIRIKIPIEGKITIEDKIHGLVTINNKEIDNFILLRNDGTPTYMLSVVVDDFDMGVNHVIRGDDHFNNAFRQIYIYKHMNWNLPVYAHLPLIHGEDGTKLSKRHGAVDINSLKKTGYLPQAIINNLILLGWSPKKNDEIIEIDEILKNFNIEKMSKSSSIFSYSKLNYFNNHYLVKKENYKYFEEYIKTNTLMKKFFDKDKIKIFKIFDTYKNKIDYYSKFESIIKIYFDELFIAKKNKILDKNFDIILKEFKEYINKIDDWSTNSLENSVNIFLKNKKINFRVLGKPLRILLINSSDGPSISEILNILGKKNTFLRINNYINNIT